jgi:hypothetical protein
MKRRHLTDEQIRKLPRKTKRYTVADPELIGHYMRVSNGVPKFLRLKGGKSISLVTATALLSD